MTATWRTREQLIQELVTLHRQGLSRRGLARAPGISRHTVKGLLPPPPPAPGEGPPAAHAVARAEGQPAVAQRPARVPRASKVDAYAPRIAALLEQYPDITSQRV